MGIATVSQLLMELPLQSIEGSDLLPARKADLMNVVLA